MDFLAPCKKVKRQWFHNAALRALTLRGAVQWIDTRRPVVFPMVALGLEQVQIFRAVVVRYAVDVMHDFGRQQESSKHALHDQSMFQDVVAGPSIRMIRRIDANVSTVLLGSSSPGLMLWAFQSAGCRAHLLSCCFRRASRVAARIRAESTFLDLPTNNERLMALWADNRRSHAALLQSRGEVWRGPRQPLIAVPWSALSYLKGAA